MKYIISTSGNSPEICRELAGLSTLGTTNTSVFGCLTHDNGDTAMVIPDLDYEVLVHPNKDTTRLKELLTVYDDETKEALDAYIDSIVIPQDPPEPVSGYVLGRFPFRNVVEGYIDIHEAQYMIDNGWNLD